MIDQAQFYYALIGLVGAVATMAGYIVHIHKIHSKLSKENSDRIQQITEENSERMQQITEGYAKEIRILSVQFMEYSTKMGHTVETNTRIIEKIYDHINS